MEKIDLHIHTTLSDGLHTIDEVIGMAKNNGCNKIAITDHEVLEDYSSYINKYGIDIINGIEFNTAGKRLHVLGYGIEDTDLIHRRMDELHKYNEQVSFEVIDLLSKEHDISLEQLYEFLNNNKINHKFIEKKHIVKYLMYMGYTNDTYETYQKLIGPNAPYYVPIKKIPTTEIIELINEARGVSVLAHPSTIEDCKDKELLYLVKEFLEHGLDGIEINNVGAKGDNIYYNEIADKLGLIKTVGSDFHTTKKSIIGVEVDEPYYEILKEKIKVKHK